MLMITMPKSASTSLLFTLSEIMKVKPVSMNDQNKNLIFKEFKEIHKWHSNMGRRDLEFFKKISKSKKELHREHTLPTEEHQDLLSKINDPILLLIRNPLDVLNAYERIVEEQKKNNEKIIDLVKIKKDIFIWFYDWISFAIDRDNFLIVNYEDLIFEY